MSGSLENYIRLKLAEEDSRLSGAANENLDKGLDEIINEGRVMRTTSRTCRGRGLGTRYERADVVGEILSNEKIVVGTNREYGEDAYKSLDEVVAQRGILKPPKYTSSSEQNDDSLPITGKYTRIGGAQRPKKTVRLAMDVEVDPMTSTLEDVIESRGIGDEVDSTVKRSGKRGKRSYEDMISIVGGSGVTVSYELGDDFGQGPTKRRQKWPRWLTPYRAVGFLAEKGMLIELKIGRLIDDEEEGGEGCRSRDHLWRCIVVCGEIEEKADSARKVVAREMACAEFLKKLRVEYPEADIPRYEISPEFLIDPKVCKWVKDLANELGFDLEFQKTVKSLDPARREKGDPNYVYISTYQFGDVTCEGVNSDEKYSALEASRKVWELFTEKKFPYTKYFLGDRCDPLLKYDFAESEVYQVMDVDLGICKPTNVVVKKEIILDGDVSDVDDDIVPVESFTSVLKRNPELNEKIKLAKQAEEHRRKKKEEDDARRNMPINLNTLTPVSSKGNTLFLDAVEVKSSVYEWNDQLNESEMLQDDQVRPVASDSVFPIVPRENEGPGVVVGLGRGIRGRGRGLGHGHVPIKF